MKIVKGDLIKLALDKQFDVIAHGLNCQNLQRSGIAKQMVDTFQTNDQYYYALERDMYRGDVNKLSQIDYVIVNLSNFKFKVNRSGLITSNMIGKDEQYYLSVVLSNPNELAVVNCYTQFEPGVNSLFPGKPPVDYNAMAMCFTKMNYLFKGLRIGLPLIGGGLAGGNANTIKDLMNYHFKDCDLTLVEYEK